MARGQKMPSVSIASLELEGASAADIGPLVDLLKEDFQFVNVAHSTFKPPLAGGGPTVLTLVSFVQTNWPWFVAAGGLAVSGFGKYASGFLEELGKLHAGRVDQRLAELTRRKKPDDDGETRQYAPLVMKVQRPLLVFDEAIDEGEFIKRRQAAADFLASLPDTAFEPRQGPPDESWYYWSERNQSWGRFNDAQQDAYDAWMRENAHHLAKEDAE